MDLKLLFFINYIKEEKRKSGEFLLLGGKNIQNNSLVVSENDNYIESVRNDSSMKCILKPGDIIITTLFKNRKLLSDPLDDNNPITVQVLGICSALAITVQLKPAIVMTMSVIFVMAAGNVIVSILRNVIADLLVANNLDDLELIKSIVNKNINHDESKKLLVFFAIRLNNWELARSSIKGLFDTNPSRELCLFMADIEVGGFGVVQKSDAWKLRAKNSDLENLWICKITNQPQNEWESLSQSGYFNSLEWKQPKMLNQFIETS